MPGNTSSSENVPSEDAPVLERLIQAAPLATTEQEPADASDLAAPADAQDLDITALPPPAETLWGNADEQEWSEHSATAWTLAYVIHRIRSTPLPPILAPEQRHRFQHVIQMAAALMEEWQRRERDQAQQLAAARPLTGLLTELPELSERAPGNTHRPEEHQSSAPHIEPDSLSQHPAGDLSAEYLEKLPADPKDET